MKRAISLAVAKSLYVHRYTMEHTPDWARKVNTGNGKYYAPQYRTDAEWYEKTVFPGEGGIPKTENACRSENQSWPLGQWLERPLHFTVRTACGHGRATYRPDWSIGQPWATYIDGTAGRHAADYQDVCAYFQSKGMGM